MQSQDATKKKLMGPILFLYYEESLVSSNLNSKLLWFHSVRPNLGTTERSRDQTEKILSGANLIFII